MLDNSNALIFIRGEKPMMDKKFDIMQHPNIKLTADGGAMPYTHDKSREFFKENLSVKLDETDGQIVIDENTIQSSGIHFVDIPTQPEPEQKNKTQPMKRRVKIQIIGTVQNIKSKLRRLSDNEKK